MPQVTSPLSSPTGMPLVNAAHVAKGGGLFMVFATAADLAAGVAAEASNWPDGQPISVAAEAGTGAVRIYRTSLGHARTVQLGSVQLVLAADANIVRPASGIPASGTGADGDRAFDPSNQAMYSKAAGAWTLTAILGGSVIRQVARGESFSLAAADNGTIIPVTGTLTATLPTGLGAFSCELRRNSAGTLTLSAGSGVTFISAGASVASIDVTTKGGFIAITPGSVANEYFVVAKS